MRMYTRDKILIRKHDAPENIAEIEEFLIGKTSVITKNISELKIDGLNKQIPIQIDGDNFGSSNKIIITSSDKKINLLKAA